MNLKQINFQLSRDQNTSIKPHSPAFEHLSEILWCHPMVIYVLQIICTNLLTGQSIAMKSP